MPVSSPVLPAKPSKAVFWRIPLRSEAPELLDLGGGSAADVRENFADMWRINRYLGGLDALTTHLYPRLLANEDMTTVADIGTGAGDIPAAIRRWANGRGLRVSLWGMDVSARNLAVAKLNAAPSLQFIHGDAFHLPFRHGSVDYFISSLFLHHLAPEQVVALLAQTFEQSRGGIIMSDLVRGWLPWFAFKLVQPVFARNYLTRHDGAVSVLRAYTPSELRELARQAGLKNARVYSHFPWRMTLVADK
jgi:2-polyprenyl-3-methyl-5-hydroxy-6-metoxy-1,4-benzoquinol methylase